MRRPVGIVLAASVVLGIVAFFIFDVAWEGPIEDGWGFGAREHPEIHGLGIALGVAWLGVFVWALAGLAHLLRPLLPVIAVLGMLLAGVGAVAGLVVAAFQVYLLAVLRPDSEREGLIHAVLRLVELRDRYALAVGVAGLALMAALSALAYGAARTGLGSRLAAWAVTLLALPGILIDWIAWAPAVAVLLFAASLIRMPGRRFMPRRVKSA